MRRGNTLRSVRRYNLKFTISGSLLQGLHCTAKTLTGKMATTKIPVKEIAGNLEILPKYGEFGAQVLGYTAS